jgi:hypothetical protein
VRQRKRVNALMGIFYVTAKAVTHKAKEPAPRIPSRRGQRAGCPSCLTTSRRYDGQGEGGVVVVHNGADAPDQNELREILWNIGQLLWIWDFYSGHLWALEHISASSVSN